MQPTHHHPKLIYARQLRQFRISYRHSMRFLFFQPMIQKLHLFLGMEPMLATGHDGEFCVVTLGKRRYGFHGGQIVVFAVQNLRRNIP